jgi:signal transduction histidine kinase
MGPANAPPPDLAPVRGPGRWTLAAITLAGVGAVGTSVALALTNERLVRPGLQAFLINWITVPYLIGGLLAWSRRPDSRLGPLMIVTGLMPALAALQWSSDPVVVSLGHLLDLVPAALFLHVFLAFPSGRLQRRSEQVLVLCCYATALGLQLLKVLVGIDSSDPLAVTTRPALAAGVEQVQLSAVAVLLLLGAASLALRRRRASRPSRRGVALTVDAFGVALVMLALLYVAGMRSWPAFEAIRNLTFAVLGLAPVAFLLGLLDARLARGDVADLVVRLRTHPTGDLQEPLARALHDPTLSIAYWLPQFAAWADQAGQPVTLPEPGDSRAARLILHDDEPVAALVFDRTLEDDHELLDAVVAAADIALENGRLQADLRARLTELQDSRVRVIEAGRKERQRLERDLHDGVQQRLVALTLELGMIGEDLSEPAARARLERVKSQVAESLEELRDVSRGIYPAVLTGHGLAVALESLAARAPLPLQLNVAVGERLPEAVEVAAYYIVCESLANIGKHAHAKSATVNVTKVTDTVVVEVSDDGVGGADTEQGTGLRGLADRVEALGGNLRIWTPPGGGTRLKAEIPARSHTPPMARRGTPAI